MRRGLYRAPLLTTRLRRRLSFGGNAFKEAPVTQRQFAWVLALAILFALPGALFAQEATATGTITDATGGVLPGGTVRAPDEESGNRFVAVPDGEGRFRLPLRIGTYRMAAELSGFATVTRTG